jgi:Tol biopolymer transport system component
MDGHPIGGKSRAHSGNRLNRMAALGVAAFVLILASCARERAITPLDQSAPALSQDGAWLLLDSIQQGRGCLLLHERSTGQTLRLTPDEVSAYHPIWSMRGQRIFFTRVEGRHHRLWSMRPDGSELRRVTSGSVLDLPLVTSPDEALLYFLRENRSGWRRRLVHEVWQVSLQAAEARPRRVSEGRSISSNGRLVLRAANPGNAASSKYLLALDGRTISKGILEAYAPTLSPDGTRVAYTWIAADWTGEVWIHDLQSGARSRILSYWDYGSPARFSLSSDELTFRRLWPESGQIDILIHSISQRSTEPIRVTRPEVTPWRGEAPE